MSELTPCQPTTRPAINDEDIKSKRTETDTGVVLLYVLALSGRVKHKGRESSVCDSQQ